MTASRNCPMHYPEPLSSPLACIASLQTALQCKLARHSALAKMQNTSWYTICSICSAQRTTHALWSIDRWYHTQKGQNKMHCLHQSQHHRPSWACVTVSAVFAGGGTRGRQVHQAVHPGPRNLVQQRAYAGGRSCCRGAAFPAQPGSVESRCHHCHLQPTAVPGQRHL